MRLFWKHMHTSLTQMIWGSQLFISKNKWMHNFIKFILNEYNPFVVFFLLNLFFFVTNLTKKKSIFVCKTAKAIIIQCYWVGCLHSNTVLGSDDLLSSDSIALSHSTVHSLDRAKVPNMAWHLIDQNWL